GLPTCRTLLEVLLGKRAPKVSTLGRWTKAAGKKAGELLAVLDEFTYDRVKQEQCRPHAASAAPQDDARLAGLEAPVLEHTHLPHRPPPRHQPLPTPGSAMARGATMVGSAQMDT